MLIDTHCHLDFHRFDDDRDAVVARAAEMGVARIIIPALDAGNWQKVLNLSEKYAGVYAAVGVHPNSSADWQDSTIGVLRDLARHPKVVAIGEIGLDYYWDKSPRQTQQRAFGRQLDLAAELGLPVIVHNRESSADVIAMLASSPLAETDTPGVLHSFSADWATAESALAMGFYLGFTGPVTFKKAAALRDVARRTPPDRILVETDAPFLTPQPHRGRRNEPGYVRYVAERLAQERGVETAVFAAQTTRNAHTLFARMQDDV